MCYAPLVFSSTATRTRGSGKNPTPPEEKEEIIIINNNNNNNNKCVLTFITIMQFFRNAYELSDIIFRFHQIIVRYLCHT